MRKVALLTLFASIGLAACGQTGSPACQAALRDTAGSVSGSFQSTLGAIREVQPRTNDHGDLATRDDDEAATLCYIDDGPLTGPRPPMQEPPGAEPPPLGRSVVVVVGSEVVPLYAGYREDVPIVAP